MLRSRAFFLRRIRTFFEERGVLEVETPLLASASGTDPHLDFFEVHVNNGPVRYLQTSPEFAMKRLLAAGSGPIYQICKAFRQSDLGRWHNPEFTILEWYRPKWSWLDLMTEVQDLLFFLMSGCIQTTQRWTYQNLFEHVLKWDPLTITDDALLHEVNTHLMLQKPVETFAPAFTRDDALQALMNQKIEPLFEPNTLYFVTHYPAPQAALARLDPEDPRVAWRFEAYLGPIELANGYDELSDPVEQEKRFLHDLALRQDIQKPLPRYDQRFLEALAHMPACAGVAMGVDRMLALAEQANAVQNILTFGWDGC